MGKPCPPVVMGIRYDGTRGVIQGGVSPRRQIGYALGW
jgi:hypothetical protein